MKIASPSAFVRKHRLALRWAAYATVIVGAAYVLVASLGMARASLEEVVVIAAPQSGLQPRSTNVPLPPVIVPPADPTRDPRFVNWALKRENSIITLGSPQGSTDHMLGTSPGTTGSILTLAPADAE